MPGHTVQSGERTVSPQEMGLRGARVASGLQRLGPGAGDGDACYLRNDLAFFEAAIGAGLVGAYPVAVNWHYTEDEARYVLEDPEARAIVIHADLLEGVRGAISDGVHVLVGAHPPRDPRRVRPPRRARRGAGRRARWEGWREPEVRARYDASSLRFVVPAAAPCPPQTKQAMIDWWGRVIHEYYGSTEVGPVTFLAAEEWVRHPGSVGKTMEGAQVRVIDEEGRFLGVGEPGEVVASATTGNNDFSYHGDQAKRRAADREGVFAPGDIGYFDEHGYLYLCDRKIAVVEVRPGAVREEEVKAFLRGRIAGFSVPKRVEFRAELPREDSGKIFKRKLRDPFWSEAGRSI